MYIPCPMDLGTVRQKLTAGEYSMPGDFRSDIELIFSNAKLYNGRGSEVSENSYWREIFFGSQKNYKLYVVTCIVPCSIGVYFKPEFSILRACTTNHYRFHPHPPPPNKKGKFML